MEFKKILLVGIDDSALNPEYWKRIDKLADKKIQLPKASKIRMHLADADCLTVNVGIGVDKNDMEAAPKLKYIGILATAYGKIDVEYAKGKGIIVCNRIQHRGGCRIRLCCDTREYQRTGAREKAVGRGELLRSWFFSHGNKGKNIRNSWIGADVRYWSRNRKRWIETKGTENFLNESRIQKIRKGAIVIIVLSCKMSIHYVVALYYATRRTTVHL